MIYILIFIIVVVIIFVTSKNKNKPSLTPIQDNSYKPTVFMTDNELEFFQRLVQAFPNHYVFPQVAMSGLVAAKSNDYKKLNGIKNTYNRLRVDFVLFKDKKVMAVIELDDKTHKNKEEKDSKRDAILEQSGYKTYRFESSKKPSIEQLKILIK